MLFAVPRRAIIRNTLFHGNAGHLAGSIMVTSGALATIENNRFTNNFTPNYGDFGGAIFHVSFQALVGLIHAMS